MRIERRTVRGGEDIKPLHEVFGIVRVVGLARWRKVERRTRTLLVQVHRHLRHPRQERPHASRRLGVRLREPVAIQIEVVVRRARTGPRARIVERLWITRDPLTAGHALEIMREAFASIRILIRVDQHHRAVERHHRLRIRPRCQLIQQRETSLGA